MSRVTAFLLVVMFIISTAPTEAQRPEPIGLEGMNITALAASALYGHPWGDVILAGTDGQGVFMFSLTDPDSDWVPLGLEGRKITALDVYHWGVGPMDYNTPFACVEPEDSEDENTLVYQFTTEGFWIPADSGISSGQSVGTMTSIATSGHEPRGPILAATGSKVFRSLNTGLSWDKLIIPEDVRINTLRTRQQDRTVWIGGEIVIVIHDFAHFFPWIARSHDQGDTWQPVDLSEVGSDMVLSIAMHPLNSDTAYASLFSHVIKTTDGGRSWKLTSLRGHSISPIRGIALDSEDPQHLWVGGSSSSNALVLFESFDGGSIWYEVDTATDKGARIAGVSGLVADPMQGGVVYIGTYGDGVWRYESSRPPRQKGDINDDGSLDVADVMILVNIIIGYEEPETNQLRAADMNNDGRIEALDVVQLIRNILGFPLFVD